MEVDGFIRSRGSSCWFKSHGEAGGAFEAAVELMVGNNIGIWCLDRAAFDLGFYFFFFVRFCPREGLRSSQSLNSKERQRQEFATLLTTDHRRGLEDPERQGHRDAGNNAIERSWGAGS